MTRTAATRVLCQIAALTWVLFALIGCTEPIGEEGEQAPQYDPVPVHVATVSTTTLRPSLDLIGTLAAIPEQTAIVSAQIAGVIDELPVIEGQTVQAGDTLVQLDPRLAKSSVTRAEAAVEEQAAIVDRLEHGPLPQEIAVARRDAEKSRINADALRARLDALVPLRQSNEVSTVQFDAAESAWQAAKAESDAASARLELLEAGTRPEVVAEAKAKLAIARADLAAAQLMEQFCRIVSPIDGQITQLNARRGMSVDPNMPLATVVDESKLFVRFRVPGAALGRVRAGAAVRIQLAAVPDRAIEGAVTRLSPLADPATGDVDALATIPNEAGELYIGLGCRITVSLPELPGALAIPAAALADRAGLAVVTIVRDGRAYEVPVTIGMKTGDLVQVTQGLSAGDTVITENGYGLPDECPVEIVADEYP